MRHWLSERLTEFKMGYNNISLILGIVNFTLIVHNFVLKDYFEISLPMFGIGFLLLLIPGAIVSGRWYIKNQQETDVKKYQKVVLDRIDMLREEIREMKKVKK